MLGKKAKLLLSVIALTAVALIIVGVSLWKNKERIEFSLRYAAEYKNACGVSFSDPTHQLATRERVVGTVTYAENGNRVYSDGLPRTFSALIRLEEGTRGGVIYGNNIGAMGSCMREQRAFWESLR